jgi:hypothetical protein
MAAQSMWRYPALMAVTTASLTTPGDDFLQQQQQQQQPVHVVMVFVL